VIGGADEAEGGHAPGIVPPRGRRGDELLAPLAARRLASSIVGRVMDRSGRLELRAWSDAPADRIAIDAVSAAAFARRFASSPEGASALRGLLAGLAAGAAVHRLPDAEIVDEIAHRIRRGELLVVPRPGLWYLGAVDGQIEDEPAPEPQAVVAEQATAWIEIELLEADGKPVPREPYEVRLPDGRAVNGRLDGNGFARLDGLVPGSCTVTFPERDRRDWEGRTVVVPEGELSTPPPPRKAWLEIELVDETGAAVADEPFLVLDEDRPVAQGRLDAQGRARVESLAPGSCEVLFPRRDARDVDVASP
jgi:hypothetical protein